MKWKEIKIRTSPIEKNLERMKISKRALAKIAGVNTTMVSEAMRNELILCEKTAKKIIRAVQYLQENPKHCKELRTYAFRSNGEKNKRRNKNIHQLRKKGESLSKIGEKYQITKERVRQILLEDNH